MIDCIHSNLPLFLFFCTDSSGQVTSSPLGSPTSHRGMHPSLLSPTSMGPSGSLHSPISTLSSPMNGLASPFSVISSPMGPHSMNSPGMGYGPSVSPQVRLVTHSRLRKSTQTLKLYVIQIHTHMHHCAYWHFMKVYCVYFLPKFWLHWFWVEDIVKLEKICHINTCWKMPNHFNQRLSINCDVTSSQWSQWLPCSAEYII